jgi:hypothetical protein
MNNNLRNLFYKLADVGTSRDQTIFIGGAFAAANALVVFDAHAETAKQEPLRKPDGNIRLLSGNYFSIETMNVDAITLDDLAIGLATKMRWNGFTRSPMTVAEHCIRMSEMVPIEHAFDALMHDCTEAILGDMPKPFKLLMPEFDQIEQRLYSKMAAHYGLSDPILPIVKEMDAQALQWEWVNIKLNKNFEPLTMKQSFLEFKKRFDFLTLLKTNFTKIPKVYADAQGFVSCPYCQKIHRHGGNGNGIAAGHRQPDCGNKTGYLVIPYNEHRDAHAARV